MAGYPVCSVLDELCAVARRQQTLAAKHWCPLCESWVKHLPYECE